MTRAIQHVKSKTSVVNASAFSTVFIDFDGTIAEHDVTDVLLERFAAPEREIIEKNWLAGTINARECMAQQIALLNAFPDALNACLDEMRIDRAFPDFIKMLTQNNINVAIVSDGLDYSIRHILQRYGLRDMTVFANRLIYNGNGHWQLQFPYENSACPSGHCKCRRFDGLPIGRTLYIGDGKSDFCPSEKADLVLAKDKLADYCAIKRLNYVKFTDFAEIMKIWPTLQYDSCRRIKITS